MKLKVLFIFALLNSVDPVNALTLSECADYLSLNREGLDIIATQILSEPTSRSFLSREGFYGEIKGGPTRIIFRWEKYNLVTVFYEVVDDSLDLRSIFFGYGLSQNTNLLGWLGFQDSQLLCEDYTSEDDFTVEACCIFEGIDSRKRKQDFGDANPNDFNKRPRLQSGVFSPILNCN